MSNTKNEHVSPEKGGWRVRREGNKKVSRLFEKRQDAMEYAGIIAFSDGGSIISHKHNGQFKKFKPGNQIRTRTHRIASIVTGTTEMTHPIEMMT